jgi:Uma2 family endonuclease
MIDGEVLIPGWVVDHESYRRWAHSDEFPKKGHYSYIDGTLWVDLTMEEFFSHNQMKVVYSGVLGPLVRKADTGYFRGDGNLWTNVEAGISTEPDSLFFTYEALRSQRVRLVKGASHGYVEMEGSPNMILEIVNDSSVKKDTQTLKDNCAKAGVDEYWLVDARGPALLFQIWCLQDGNYALAANEDGWLASTVFGHSFKLEQGKDRLGHPQFELLVR